MSATPVCIYTTNNWKDKLRVSKIETKQLKKENKRLHIRIAKGYQIQQNLKAEIVKLKESSSNLTGSISLGSKPKRHKYGLILIFLAVHLQSLHGLSYRQTREVLLRYISLLGLKISVPSATSIRNWVQKLAYFRVYGQEVAPSAGRILLVDESASIGQEKVLLLLSLDEEKV